MKFVIWGFRYHDNAKYTWILILNVLILKAYIYFRVNMYFNRPTNNLLNLCFVFTNEIDETLILLE